MHQQIAGRVRGVERLKGHPQAADQQHVLPLDRHAGRRHLHPPQFSLRALLRALMQTRHRSRPVLVGVGVNVLDRSRMRERRSIRERLDRQEMIPVRVRHHDADDAVTTSFDRLTKSGCARRQRARVDHQRLPCRRDDVRVHRRFGHDPAVDAFCHSLKRHAVCPAPAKYSSARMPMSV